LGIALEGLPVPSIYYYASIGSTNDFARSLAENDTPDGTLVVADEQTEGRGRFNRRWETPPGSALAFSLVLHPGLAEMPRLGLFSGWCGLAVCSVLRRVYGLDAQIKWPNDVLVERRKVCGILVEAHWLGSRLQGVIAGIGVNVSPPSVPPPDHVIFPAACVEQFLGRPVERERLLAEILNTLIDLRPSLGSPQFLDSWEEWLAFKGEWVKVEQPGESLTGQVVGIAGFGGLRLRVEDGREVEVAVGDVRLRPAAE